ncbi:hypothetical protein H9P43_007547 [Blastocladiella emersonii ATCC 22665]|nr:hypothetical protein H9P43_007547 [Blastocladiella emersonii ATCC 22665]
MAPPTTAAASRVSATAPAPLAAATAAPPGPVPRAVADARAAERRKAGGGDAEVQLALLAPSPSVPDADEDDDGLEPAHRHHIVAMTTTTAPPKSSPPRPPLPWHARHATPASLLLAAIPAVALGTAFPFLVRADPSAVPAWLKIMLILVLSSLLCLACLRPALAYSPPRAIPAPLAVVPLVCYLLLFSLANRLPLGWFPEVNTTWLPMVDTLLVGRPAYEYFDAHPAVVLDVVGWLLYGVLHYLSAVLVGVGLLVWGWLRTPPPSRERDAWWVKRLAVRLDAAAGLLKAFLVVFGCCNLSGVMIQYVFPTAAPWYNIKYGSTVPVVGTVAGDPAGLARVDAFLGFPLYGSVFGNSPLVFGAFPSLHSGYAVLLTAFVGDQFRWIAGTRVPTAAVGAGYVLGIWWSTMYFDHHFLIDVLAGGAESLLFYALARRAAAAIRGQFQLVLQLQRFAQANADLVRENRLLNFSLEQSEQTVDQLREELRQARAETAELRRLIGELAAARKFARR